MRTWHPPESPRIHIVGHGLAGAILAQTLSEAGYTLTVTDNGGPSSSRVAAGLFTPLTGRRLTPSWALDEALPRVHRFYPSLEKKLGCAFYHSLPTLRKLPPSPPRLIEGGGWVDLPVMLDALRQRREQHGEFGSPDSTPDLTIWAEGAAAADNPLWRDLGWRNAHGDVLTLHIPDHTQDHVLNFGRFLLPLGGHHYRLGSTYAWGIKDPSPRKEGRETLEAELRAVLPHPFEVIDHQAGIRPVAVARVPVAGPHPEKPGQWIFNGFGSKGVLYAPWMAERLLQFLRDLTPLPKPVQAARRMERNRDRMRSAAKENRGVRNRE